ncbi:MAG: SDR family oxidoreductase [Beijerinckiaceae bacterium]
MSVVLVTGCSSGFGEAIARGFARRGDTVCATMRRPQLASKELAQQPGIEISALDVTDRDSRIRAIEAVLSRHSRIDVLVNNAGVAVFGSIEDVPENVARLVFETNYFAAVELMRLVLPGMRKQGAGRIVNISAVGAILATPLLGVYAATKHALDAATAAVDIEARPFGVRAISILPGQFRTAIGEKSPGRFIADEYRGIAASMDRWRAANAADVLEDLGPVVEATIQAAHAPRPRARYVVGIGLADRVRQAARELDELHEFESARAGVVD